MRHFPHPNDEMMKSFSPYPVIFVHEKTSEIVCEKCAINMCKDDEQKKELYDNYVYDNYLEGDGLSCDSCNELIDSAYGNPESDDIE